MKKTVIYGGSFDPVHKGHAYIIGRLQAVFDRVIVVPSFISPFKTAGSAASAAHRIQMLRLALAEEGLSAEISDFETQKQGISYSIDTVRHYLVPDEKLYFALGSEALPTLHLWKDFDTLKSLVTFYAVARPGFKGKNPDAVGFNIESATFAGPDISSSLVKAALAAGQPQNMLADSVIKYIESNDLYKKYTQIRAALKLFDLKRERINHTFSAVKYGVRLAKIHGEDTEKTVTALLLHDIGKNADSATLNSCGITIPDMAKTPEKCRHAIVGACIARQYLGVTDKDILNAIRYHTTGRAGMSRLEKIVALADYLEEGRRFPGVEDIRLEADSDLDKAMAAMLGNVIKYLEGTKAEIDPLSAEALKFYLKN